jgi:hypothetical protein
MAIIRPWNCCAVLQMFQEYVKRPLGLILLVLMVLMGFEAGTKKPLCISSNIVNKIDRITAQPSKIRLQNNAITGGSSKETIYSCSVHKIPAFSAYFQENSEELSSKLGKIEKIAALSGMHGKLDVVIDENQTDILKLDKNVLVVSTDKLNDPEFSKLFMLGLMAQSKVSESEAFNTFLAGWLSDDVQDDSVMEEVWKESFDSLSLFQKFEFKEAVFSNLRKTKYFSNKSVTENMMTLLESQKSSVKFFKDVLSEKLKTYGLIEGSSTFDLVFQNLNQEKADIKNLITLAKEHKDKRILFQDGTGSYILPFMIPLSDDLNKSVTANLKVLMAGKNSKVSFEKYFGNTERLMIFKSTGEVEELKWKALFATDDLIKNEIALLHDNKTFDVIQFHVPSMKSRQAQLKHIGDYFNLLKDSKADAKKIKLGWDSEQWSSDAQAYKPVAIYDVIQYYRIN